MLTVKVVEELPQAIALAFMIAVGAGEAVIGDITMF